MVLLPSLRAHGESAALAQTELVGLVTHVRAGNTIGVEGVGPTRLEGLHAPELHQEGGEAASAFMRTLVEGQAHSLRVEWRANAWEK